MVRYGHLVQPMQQSSACPRNTVLAVCTEYVDESQASRMKSVSDIMAIGILQCPQEHQQSAEQLDAGLAYIVAAQPPQSGR